MLKLFILLVLFGLFQSKPLLDDENEIATLDPINALPTTTHLSVIDSSTLTPRFLNGAL